MRVDVDPDWWKTLFDEIYLITDARTVCDDDVTRREIDLFCSLIPMAPQDHILDLCGGHGRHTLELCRRGFLKCSVLDYSRTLLKIGAEKAGQENFPIRFIHGDARHTKLADQTYDHVLILGNSLGYVPDDQSDLSIFKESFRLLKSNGWLLVDVTDGKSVSGSLTANAWHEIGDDVIVCRQREIRQNTVYAREVVLSRRKGLIRDKTYCIRLYAPQQLAALVAKAGFSDVRVYADPSQFQSKHDLGCMNHRVFISARKFTPGE